MPEIFDYAPAPESRSIVDIKPSYGLFVGAEFDEGHGTSFKSTNAATEEDVLTTPAGLKAVTIGLQGRVGNAIEEAIWIPGLVSGEGQIAGHMQVGDGRFPHPQQRAACQIFAAGLGRAPGSDQGPALIRPPGWRAR